MPKRATTATLETRNQVFLEKLKVGEHKKFLPFLKELEKSIRQRLQAEGDTIASKSRLNRLLADLKSIQATILKEYTDQLKLDLGEISEQQGKFEKKALDTVVAEFETVLPSPDQLLTAMRVTPLAVQNINSEALLEPFIKDWSDNAVKSVNNIVRQGYAQGATVNEMVKSLKGSPAAKFNDGKLAKINRDNRAIIRTSVQHAATTARYETMRKNDKDVKGYKWVSTLDNRTTLQCASLDGRVFQFGKGPLPPIHVNCRSAIVPVLSSEFDFLDKGSMRASKGAEGGQPVSAKLSYYEWLKKQPVTFQNLAIGKGRAKLLRDGGISAKKFAELSIDKNYEPMTLQQMKEKMPAIFERAGVEVVSR